MIRIRPGNERGFFDHGWLKTYHTFSFGDYEDPNYMGYRSLRVINEDFIQAGMGFGTHRHRDMEIVTYVLSGALEHKDSLGSQGVIRPGEVQRMTAGTGIAHSEFNHSYEESTHLLQIWVLPSAENLPPSYEQKPFPESGRQGKFQLMVSPSGEAGSLKIHQNWWMRAAVLNPGEKIRYPLTVAPYAWVQVAWGELVLGPHTLTAGDGAALAKETVLELEAKKTSEILLFEMT